MLMGQFLDSKQDSLLKALINKQAWIMMKSLDILMGQFQWPLCQLDISNAFLHRYFEGRGPYGSTSGVC
jgi:hypothetical protein